MLRLHRLLPILFLANITVGDDLFRDSKSSLWTKDCQNSQNLVWNFILRLPPVLLGVPQRRHVEDVLEGFGLAWSFGRMLLLNMRRIKIVNLSERKFASAGLAFRHILKPLKARKKQPREIQSLPLMMAIHVAWTSSEGKFFARQKVDKRDLFHYESSLRRKGPRCRTWWTSPWFHQILTRGKLTKKWGCLSRGRIMGVIHKEKIKLTSEIQYFRGCIEWGNFACIYSSFLVDIENDFYLVWMFSDNSFFIYVHFF